MEFYRKKYVRGMNPKVYREWYDESKEYRINWRTELDGIPIRPHFYACIRCERFDGKPMWDFCGKRGPYKTLRKAIEAAETHRKVWEKWFAIMAGPYKGRAAKLLDLRIGPATVGGENTINCILNSLPIWVLQRANAKELRLLRGNEVCSKDTTDEEESQENHNDPSPILKTSASTTVDNLQDNSTSSTIPTHGPASNVLDTDTSGSPTKRRKRRKVAATPEETTVTNAKVKERARKKIAKSPTTKKSKRGKKKSVISAN